MIKTGRLYVVSTPIGNMGDLSARAREVLAGVAVVAAEDTRHSGRLLQALGISRPLVALHEHHEVDELLDDLSVRNKKQAGWIATANSRSDGSSSAGFAP